jgi:hypothetical protein
MEEKVRKYPEGHFLGMWIGIGIAIFSGIGVPLSFVLGSPGFIGIGPALGVAFGVAVGQSIEEKHRKEGRIRPLTKEERKIRQNLVIAGIAALLMGVAVFIMILFYVI